jgi:hypothetical protein
MEWTWERGRENRMWRCGWEGEKLDGLENDGEIVEM